MPFDRLAIPLSTNPTRQKFWRVVGLLVMIVTCAGIGFGLDRMWHYRSSTARWPSEATLEFRVIKTPRTTNLVQDQFGSTQALPGAPWTITEAMTWSKREFNLYADANKVVGLRVDGQIPNAIQAALPSWGWQTTKTGQQTLIYKINANEPLPSARHTNSWLLIPYFDGAVTVLSANAEVKSLPFHLSHSGLTLPVNMEQHIPTTNLALPEETSLLGSFALSAEESGTFFPQNISATFPGLESLSRTSLQDGVDLLLGVDDTGLAFLAAGKTTNLDLEQLGAIATEGLALQNLSTTALTSDDFAHVTEIRSSGDISVDVNTNNDLSTAVAKNATGEVFRLTQSPANLIISNRPTNIGVRQAKYNSTCLKRAAGFIKPIELLTQVPTLAGTLGSSPEAKLMHASEIAFRKHWLKICW